MRPENLTEFATWPEVEQYFAPAESPLDESTITAVDFNRPENPRAIRKRFDHAKRITVSNPLSAMTFSCSHQKLAWPPGKC
jgi:hypothetical protein